MHCTAVNTASRCTTTPFACSCRTVEDKTLADVVSRFTDLGPLKMTVSANEVDVH